MFSESDLGLDLACIGVEDVAEAAGSPLNGFAPYKMANLTHGSHSSDLLKRPGNLRHFRLFWVDFCSFSAVGHALGSRCGLFFFHQRLAFTAL
jgi:hypothetical protein